MELVRTESNRHGIVGRSRMIGEVLRRIELSSTTRSTVLITGETGTGKELVAQAIHTISAQRDKPFIKVNCAAIPESLIESELFGHDRGLFLHPADEHALRGRRRCSQHEIGVRRHDGSIRSKVGSVERAFEIAGAEIHVDRKCSRLRGR